LREAIDIANGPTPASLMLCPGSLTLTSDIDITGKEFTLSCHGAGEPCSVSGGKSTRLFRGGPTSAVFDGVTFEDAVGDQGAAFYIVGGSVVMTNCIFQNNVGILGGAVYVDIDGILQFESGSFLSNTAEEEGGAIYALHGAVRLVESLFQFNQAGSVRWFSIHDAFVGIYFSYLILLCL
jgi:predicted outer membrane repeat protein